MFGVVDSVENGKDSTAGIANCGCVSQSFMQSVTHNPIVRPSLQMCSTFCLNIISWKISPPVLPMNLHMLLT